MYNFIVLGIVPGTRIQLNFYEFTLGISMLAVTLGVLLLFKGRMSQHTEKANHSYFDLISL